MRFGIMWLGTLVSFGVRRGVLLAGLLLGALAPMAVTQAGVFVPGSDEQLQYTGRIDFANPANPVLTWPGTSITGRFTGPSLALALTDIFGKNYYNVFIDGDYSRPIVIACAMGSRTYVVTTNLSPGPHTFLITKRTEGEEGATLFHGLVLADGEKMLPPPPRARRRIEFFGDSITSGMGNEAPDTAPDDLSSQKNNFWAYGAITARNLQAEMHSTSQSGIGLMVSWFDFTMPQFYNQLSAVGKNGTQWDFSRWTPDVVVVNLLQNDSWLIDRDHTLKPEPTEAQRVQAYVDFIQTLRSKYPKAYIICTLGSMDAAAPGSKWPGIVRSAVAHIKQKNAKEKIDTLFFDYTGYGGHPRIPQQQVNADKLTALIRQKMGWK